MEKYWTNRRTIRKYSDREVSGLQLTSLLEQASHSPNTGNMQLYSVVVTRDKSLLDALRPLHFNQPASMAPVLLTFCADINRFVQWCEASRAEAGFDNAQMLLAAILDATIFTQQFVTLAEREGLGCCYLGTTTYNADRIAETLHLPKLVVPVATISVGWPAEEGSVSDRLPVEAVIHNETYTDYTPETISKFYSPKESLPENIRFVEENGKETLAQVFTDVRYPRSSNETFSKTLVEFLKKQGF